MEQRYLTPREVGAILGRSHHTVVNWFQAGTLPGHKIEGRWCIGEDTLSVWIKKRDLNRSIRSKT